MNNYLLDNKDIFMYFLCNKEKENDRYKHLCYQIKQADIPLEKYEIFTYIWGNEISDELRDKYCKSDYSMKFHNRTMKEKPLTNGEISLFLNHIECLRKIRKEYNSGLFFIFESDVIFCKNFKNLCNKICQEISCIDNWDVINIGEGTRDYLKTLKYPKSKPIQNKNFTFYNESIHSCTEGLLWNYTSVCKFLGLFESDEDINGPIDTKMDIYSKDNKLYIHWAYPILVSQGSITGLFNTQLR